MAAIDKYIHGIKEKINQIQSDLDIENSKIKRKNLLQEKALYQFFLFIIENEKYKFAEQGQLDWLDNFLCDPIVDNDAKQQLQALIDTVGSQHFNALNTLLLVTIIGGAGFATVAMMINLGLLTGPFIAFLVLSILPITILESSIVATPFACILLMCNLVKVELEKSTERTALKFFDIPASKPDTKVTQEEISQKGAFSSISIPL